MSKHIDLLRLAGSIIDALRQNIDITISSSNISSDLRDITIYDRENNDLLAFSIHDSDAQPCVKAKPAAPVTAIPAATAPKKPDFCWWSRFNFEKNIMKMTLLALQERYPCETSFPQKIFALKLARLMGWQLSTARRHITQAAKMGVIARAVIGTDYHIMGLNDVSVEDAQQEVAERQEKPAYMPLRGEVVDEDIDQRQPAFYREFLDEGKPSLEQEMEKAIDEGVQQTINFDETILP